MNIINYSTALLNLDNFDNEFEGYVKDYIYMQ